MNEYILGVVHIDTAYTALAIAFGFTLFFAGVNILGYYIRQWFAQRSLEKRYADKNKS